MKIRNLALGLTGAVGAAVAVKMLTRAASVDWDDVSDSVEHSENSHFVSVDGARLHFQEFGNAGDPPIVLIHGYTASTYVWRSVAPMLADAGFHVVALDLIGFGFSEKPRWFDYSIDSQARMVSRFMDRIGIGRAVVVGSSYGGAVASTLALDYSERVEKLVLVDAVANDNLRQHPILKICSVPGVGEALTPFLADTKAFHRHRMYQTLSPANHGLISQERVEAIVRPLAAADAHHSLLATSRNWHANRITYDAHLINQPTLIIWGEDDKVIPITDAYTLHDRILHSRLVMLKHCGHVPMEEKSDLFAELVVEFCRDQKGRITVAANEDFVVE
ncbi:MAG TPA: alpha/beta hydrolase [Pyrinomonadaceae bacterium]|nr:alpha/beta hydrolase [Pyrinomonadaceae bacterium]